MKTNLSPPALTSLINQALFERWLTELEINLIELLLMRWFNVQILNTLKRKET